MSESFKVNASTMKNEHKILVTGVGALIGQGICKNLKEKECSYLWPR